MKTAAARLAFALALTFSAFSSGAWARPAILSSENVPAFRAASNGAHGALPDAQVYDLSAEEPDAILGRLESDAPEVIVAVGPAALKLAARTHRRAPIVFVMVYDASAIVGSLDGRPLVGVGLTVAPEAVLVALGKITPKAHRYCTVYAERESGRAVAQLKAATAARGLELEAREAHDAADAVRAILASPTDCEAFLLLPDRVVRSAAADEALLRLAFSRRVPVVGISAADVRGGALFALQLDPRQLGAQAGALTRRVLSDRAAKPEVVPPQGHRLVLNAATARRLGLQLPSDLVAGAEVIGQ